MYNTKSQKYQKFLQLLKKHSFKKAEPLSDNYGEKLLEFVERVGPVPKDTFTGIMDF
jgi:hypothetical protein